MSYAGNPTLASDIQQRILETFRHTLDVAGRGSLEEARLGAISCCSSIPVHAGAHALRTAAGRRRRGGVDDLRARLDGAPAPAAAAARPAAPPAAARPLRLPPARPRL